MKKIEYPDRLARPVAQALIDAARALPADVRSGHRQLDDLEAVLAGRPAPSRAAKTAYAAAASSTQNQ